METAMDILGIVRKQCVAASRSVSDKSGALDEMAGLAASSGLLGSVTREDVRRGLEEREAVGTTGFGKGIAIPHCRLDAVSEFIVGVMTVPEGVDFDSLDGDPVKLFVFIVGPSSESTEHIKVLSAISRVLSDQDAVGEMVAAANDESLYESLTRHLSDEPKAEAGEPRSIFYVFIQDEDIFHDVLQVFGGTEPRFTAVLDSRDANSYLAKVPLFAGLWSDAPESFNRVIISLVSKRMTNEMIRRVEAIVGPLSKSRSVLVVVQDTFFTGGSLGR